MVRLGNSGADVEPITNKGNAEVVGGVLGGAKKWTVEEDKRLIHAWLNIGTDAVVGSDQKMEESCLEFQRTPPTRSLNSILENTKWRWSGCFPLVSKWAGILLEVKHC